MSRLFQILLIAVLTMGLYLGGRWIYYIDYSEDLYDPTGIGLTTYIPEPIRGWGCRRLALRFANRTPPPVCQSAAVRSAIAPLPANRYPGA
jgi:hypothetical protein